jgi:hypothetical protein
MLLFNFYLIYFSVKIFPILLGPKDSNDVYFKWFPPKDNDICVKAVELKACHHLESQVRNFLIAYINKINLLVNKMKIIHIFCLSISLLIS